MHGQMFIITTPNLHPSMATRALIGFLREELGKLEVFRDAVA